MKKALFIVLALTLSACATTDFTKTAGPPAPPRPKQVTSAEITAGTETKLRSYSPENITSFVTTHGGADAFTVKVDSAATAGYLYNAGSGTVRAGTNVTIDDNGDYITINASLTGGAVDTSGTLNADEIAVMFDLDTIKSLTEAEFKAAYNMVAGTDYLAPISGNDPVLAFDETDGTDWELRVDDTGNSFEIGSSQGGVGDNVELEIDEDGDLHVTGDIYIEGALAEVGGTDPIYRFDETDGTDWEIRVDDTGNSLEIGSSAGGVGDNVEIEIDEDGDLHVTKDIIAAGDITVTGDDIFATTNTAGYIWVGDDTNYNPVAVSGNITLGSNGAVAVVDFGLTTDADAGDFDITSVDKLEGVDNAVFLDLGANGIAELQADTQIQLDSPAVIQYEATNDGNPSYKQGATDTEETLIKTVFDTGAQTVDYLLIQTQAASATADKGRMLFSVDEQQTFSIDDNGINVGANGVDGTITIYSEQGGTDYAVVFQPNAAMTETSTITLPPADGTADQFLKTDGSGNWSWGDPAGAGTITAVGDTTSGLSFTGGASDGCTSNTLYFEGSTVNDVETILTAENAVTTDKTVTIPAETGTIVIGPSDFGTDNRLIKTNGTGNLTQITGITVDDSNNVSAVGTLGITGDLTIATADPDIVLDDTDGANGLIQIAATDADDSVMTLAVDDSGGDDQGYIELDGVNETVDVLQNATFSGTVGITGAVTLSSTITDGTATLNAGAWSGISTLAVTDAISLSDGATIDQSANNYVEIAENSDQVQFGFGGTDLDIIWSDGALNLRNAEDSVDAIVEIEGKDAGEKGVLRVLSDGDDKYITVYHDDTDSWVASSSGDIILAPDGDVDDYLRISTTTNVPSIAPSAADDGTLGTSSNEWSDAYFADGAVIYLGADQDVTLTHVADTGIDLNESLGIADGKFVTFGGNLSGSDWTVGYDETTDDAIEFTTAATAAATTGDPMFLINVDSGSVGMTADQDIFAIYKGTTELFTVDEDGDVYVLGSITTEPGNDPGTVFNESSSGDTDFWLANDGDQQSDNDDLFSIGTGTTIGSNTIWTLNPSGDMNVTGGTTTDTLTLYGGTYSTTLSPGTPTASVSYQWPLDDGTNGQVLTTNASGVMSWTDKSAAAAQGGDTAIQWSNAGVFGGEAAFTYEDTNNTLSITQAASNPTVQVGDGTYSWGHTPQVGIEGTLEVDSTAYFDATTGIVNAGALDQNEDIDIDFDANDEELSLDSTAVDYAAGAGIVTIHGNHAGNTNDAPLLRLVYQADGDAQDTFILCEDNSTGAAGNGDDMFKVGTGGAVTATGLGTFSGGVTIGTGTHITVGSTQWDNGADAIDGERLANDTVDDDSLDFADITLDDFVSAEGDYISVATDDTFDFTRNDTGIVTITASDDDAIAALTIVPGGAAALTLGGASTTAITLTTDSTGDAEVVLPNDSIGPDEMASGAYDLGTSLEADTLTENSNAVPNVTDDLSVFAATTSAQLYGVLSDETGSGAGALAVFNSNPTLDGATITSTVSAGLADSETVTIDGANDTETMVTLSLNIADITGDTTALLITAVDNDDANYIPLLIQDDQDGTPDNLMSVNYVGAVSAAGGFLPMAADGAAVGSATLEISDIYLADGGVIYFQNDQSVYLTPSASTLTLTGQMAATAGMDIGISQAIVGTTAMTIGNNGQTVAINSSDWDIDATGVMTGMGNITSDGTITASTSIVAPLYDVSGAAGITLGSADVTAFTFSGQSEDLVLTPSANTWTFTSSTAVDTVAFGSTITTLTVAAADNPYIVLDDNDDADFYIINDDVGQEIEFSTDSTVSSNNLATLSETGTFTTTAGVTVGTLLSTSPQSLSVTTEADITLTGSMLLLTGDDDEDNDAIDLQNGTTAGQHLVIIGVAGIDGTDTITVAMTDTTCTGCSTVLFDEIGDSYGCDWTGATWNCYQLNEVP